MRERFVSAAEVGERLGVSPDTVTRWCREGRIPGMKPGRDWRIPASVVEDLLEGRPSRHWSADLGRRLASIRPPAHVLALVPGRAHDARRFAGVLEGLGLPARRTPEPPAAPAGGIFPRTVLLAALRASAQAELELLAEAEEPFVLRFVGRGAGLVRRERRMDRLARARGKVVVCIAALGEEPEIGALLPLHTHLLLGAVHGRSWLSRSEPAAAAGEG
ncbi:MAG TPA: helix-turn-helix domain-containing protein [Actinomycetota bacterium]|nr:helix-turn-helix domain-containing protein [Actinomycetota bacterium]